MFWSVSSSENPLYLIALSKNGVISFVLKQMLRPLNYTNVITATRNISFGVWTHIAATCQGNRIKMYVNGDHQISTRTNIPFPVTEELPTDMSSEKLNSYYIGIDPRKEFKRATKFYGSVIDLHVIGVALSSADISDLFHGKIS